MSSCVNFDDKRKYILALGEVPTHGLDGTKLTAKKKYSINFTVTRKKFCLILHYNGANSYLFFNDTEIIKFKAKDSDQSNSVMFRKCFTRIKKRKIKCLS